MLWWFDQSCYDSEQMATIFVSQLYHQLHLTFALLDNQMTKKKDGLEIYIVPQGSSNTKYTGSCLL